MSQDRNMMFRLWSLKPVKERVGPQYAEQQAQYYSDILARALRSKKCFNILTNLINQESKAGNKADLLWTTILADILTKIPKHGLKNSGLYEFVKWFVGQAKANNKGNIFESNPLWDQYRNSIIEEATQRRELGVLLNLDQDRKIFKIEAAPQAYFAKPSPSSQVLPSASLSAYKSSLSAGTDSESESDEDNESTISRPLSPTRN